MYPTNSPLEHLTAFAIVFVTGVVSTISLAKYLEKVRKSVAQ